MVKPIEYERKPRIPLALVLGVAIFTAVCVAILVMTISSMRTHQSHSQANNLGQYDKEVQRMDSNASLSDRERARLLLQVISARQLDGTLPLRAPWPSEGEKQLAVLLSDPKVKAEIKPEEADRYLSWLHKSYPTFNLEGELWLRQRQNKGTGQ